MKKEPAFAAPSSAWLVVVQRSLGDNKVPLELRLLTRGGTASACSLMGQGVKCECARACVCVCGGGRAGGDIQRHLRARVEGAEGRWADGRGRVGSILPLRKCVLLICERAVVP